MQNTQNGFIGIALVLILAIALGAGGIYYATNQDATVTEPGTYTSTSVDQKVNPPNLKNPTTGVATSVPVVKPVDPKPVANAKSKAFLEMMKSDLGINFSVEASATSQGKGFSGYGLMISPNVLFEQYLASKLPDVLPEFANGRTNGEIKCVSFAQSMKSGPVSTQVREVVCADVK